MPKKDEIKFSRRLFVISSLKISLFSTLIARLYKVQFLDHDKYKSMSDKNRIKTFFIPANRGNFVDRNGSILAMNKPIYSVAYDGSNKLSKSDIRELMDNLSYIFDLESEDVDKIKQNITNSKNRSVIIYENVDFNTISKIEFNSDQLPGLIIVKNHIRYYPYLFICSHLIGYVSNNKNYNEEGDKVGQVGLEGVYDKYLRGEPAVLVSEVNAFGEKTKDILFKEEVNVKDLKLAIDIELQSYIYSIMNNVKGAVIVMDVRTGEVVALCSFPTYDNNLFSSHISHKKWAELNDKGNMPLFNRATMYQIQPGSTFKLISAIAALNSNVVNENTEFNCTGSFKVGNKIVRCWKHGGHGLINFKQAIASSCNVYFYNIARDIDMDVLNRTAKDFGVEGVISSENYNFPSGNLPTREWLYSKNIINWSLGDTINSIIGHGYINTTPLHLVSMVARIATKKKIIPQFFYKNNNINYDYLNYSDHIMDIVREGMYGCVNLKGGTSFSVNFNREHAVVGKTGTVQVVASASNNFNSNSHALFVGYAPFYSPRYATSVLIEHAGYGFNASKIAKKIFSYLHNKEL